MDKLHFNDRQDWQAAKAFFSPCDLFIILNFSFRSTGSSLFVIVRPQHKEPSVYSSDLNTRFFVHSRPYAFWWTNGFPSYRAEPWPQDGRWLCDSIAVFWHRNLAHAAPLTPKHSQLGTTQTSQIHDTSTPVTKAAHDALGTAQATELRVPPQLPRALLPLPWFRTGCNGTPCCGHAGKALLRNNQHEGKS